MHVTIHTDGGSRGNPGHAAIGVVVDADGQNIAGLKEYVGIKTNNEAEYLAFKLSVKWVKEHQALHKIENITWLLDSMLVVEQLNRKWKIKEPRMLEMAKEIWQELSQLEVPYTIKHVPRAENAEADRLVNEALDGAILQQ